jgi:hypothetical protein
MWWVRATGDHAGQTVIATTIGSGSLACSVFRGCVATGSPFNQFNAAGHNSSTSTRTGFTTTVDGCALLLAVCEDDDITVTSESVANVPGMVTLVEGISSGGGPNADSLVSLSYVAQATQGATGNFTWVIGSSEFTVTVIAALIPEPDSNSKTLGIITSSTAVLQPTFEKHVNLGVDSALTTAQSFDATKHVSVNPKLASSTAQALTFDIIVVHRKDLIPATSANAAQGVGVHREVSVDPVISTSASQDLVVAKTYTIDLVASTATVQEFNKDKHGNAHVILEFGNEQSLNLSKVIDLSVVAETDAEQVLILHQVVMFDVAVENGVVQSFVVTKTIRQTLGVVQRTDDVIMLQYGLGVALSSAVENSDVQALNVEHRKDLGTVVESDNSQNFSVTKVIQVTLDLVLETSVTQTFSYSQAGTFEITSASEVTNAQGVTFAKANSATLVPIAATSFAMPLTYAQAGDVTLVPVFNADTAVALIFAQTSDVVIQPAVSDDVVVPLSFQKPSDFDIQSVMSTATVQGVTYKRALAVTVVNEIGVARSFSGKSIYVIVPVQCTTVILPFTGFIQGASYDAVDDNAVYNAGSAATYEEAVGTSIRTADYDD